VERASLARPWLARRKNLLHLRMVGAHYRSMGTEIVVGWLIIGIQRKLRSRNRESADQCKRALRSALLTSVSQAGQCSMGLRPSPR
jgi:hypothetical protein